MTKEDICVRLEHMNKRYIRKPECKETLTDAVKEIRYLRKKLEDLRADLESVNHFAPTYRG